MPKLTDTQLVILSAAARRDDGAALPLPKSLKIRGAAVTRTLEGLCKKGLLEEKPAPREAAAWCDGKNGRRMMLVITEAGLTAIDGGPAAEPRKAPGAAKGRSKLPRGERKTAGANPKAQQAAPAVRQSTKQALLIDLLKRKSGATIDEIVEATGWQPHSVRAALTGLRKRGIEVTRAKEGDATVYHAKAA